MSFFRAHGAVLLLAACAVQVFAQVPPPADKSSDVRLEDGTPVRLKLAHAISTRTAAPGDPVEFVLAEDLIVDDALVAPAGSVALGTIAYTRRAATGGRGAELSIDFNYVKCGRKRVMLRGAQRRSGEGKVGTTVALTVLFGAVGMLKHGNEVEFAKDQVVTAYVVDDHLFPRVPVKKD